jgi:hypothetical protein
LQKLIDEYGDDDDDESTSEESATEDDSTSDIAGEITTEDNAAGDASVTFADAQSTWDQEGPW